MTPMNRVGALTLASLILAPAVAQACPLAAASAGCGGCGGGSLLMYVIAFVGGLLAGIGSIGFSRRS